MSALNPISTIFLTLSLLTIFFKKSACSFSCCECPSNCEIFNVHNIHLNYSL